jgi:hypothetical protein
VLATFVVVPMRWLERYGWRPVTTTERRAAYLYYRELGRRMGIRTWPEDYDAVVAFFDDYEAERFARTPGGVRTAVATRELFVSWFPRPLALVLRTGVHALLDPPLLEAFGFDPAPAWVVTTAEGALRARARVVRMLPPRRAIKPVSTSTTVRSYPDGYLIERLGTG